MYRLMTIEETVRIPPDKLNKATDEIVHELVWETFEGRLSKEVGFIVMATDVERLGPGKMIHGDGGVYQRVKFKALTFLPEAQEVVEGHVVEVANFGAFVRLGPLDGLLHMSQIMNDFINVDAGNQRLRGKETGRTLGLNEKVRGRIVTVSLNEANPRESRIGLTMRQVGLGKLEWIPEDIEAAKKGEVPAKRRPPRAEGDRRRPRPERRSGGGRS